MQLRCPNCGAAMSLELLVDEPAAAAALQHALAISPLGPLLVKYLGLFRPAKNKLSWSRVAALLGELAEPIRTQRIERAGQVWDVDMAGWERGLTRVLAARDAGRLRTPLSSHGYLLEVLVSEAERARPVAPAGVLDAQQSSTAPAQPTQQATPSSTASAIARLQQRKENAHAQS